MKIVLHKGLTKEQWFAKNIFEQMANIGSEIERAILWREKDDKYYKSALERGLELIDLTANDPKNIPRLKEILRSREAVVDYFLGSNEYGSSDQLWRNYYYSFNYAARLNT